jgi:hypothetical protein
MPASPRRKAVGEALNRREAHSHRGRLSPPDLIRRKDRQLDGLLGRSAGRFQTSAYTNIPASVTALCGVVSRMRITNRNNAHLCDMIGRRKVKEDAGASATKALEAERTRPWTEQEIAEYQARRDGKR